MPHNYTYIDDVLCPVWQCDDCGAYAKHKKDIVHYDSCVPGESKMWEEFYDRVNEEEENEEEIW